MKEVSGERHLTMSTEYKILYFVANPIAGVRVPIALLLREPEKPLVVIKNPSPPSGECLGDPYAASAIQHALPRVDRLENFDRLPALFGPQFALSEARSFYGVDARERLTKAIFPTFERQIRKTDSKDWRKIMTRFFEDIGMVTIGLLLPLHLIIGLILVLPLMALELCHIAARPYFPTISRPSIFDATLRFLLVHFFKFTTR